MNKDITKMFNKTEHSTSIQTSMFISDFSIQSKENMGIDNKKIYINDKSIFIMGFNR